MKINEKVIDKNNPTYFIADIAANHDGDLNRAINLIYKAAEAGADAAKFQHFSAKTIVSDLGFKKLGSQKSHQSKWNKSVFEVYDEASINLEWTEKLKKTCDDANIAFFTSPYSKDLVDHVDPYVPAYKIGSGDITWLEIIEYISKKNKPVILATGASNLNEVKNAVSTVLENNKNFALMQCNTNYTGENDNFYHINLNVINQFKEIYPDIVIGLSDHTPYHSTVLGAIALGARIIEKHFTDDNEREGPDHIFSMNPNTWKEMVERSRELEFALGDGQKKIEKNELETSVIQRRGIYLKNNLKEDEIIKREDLIPLRPALKGFPQVDKINEIVGRKSRRTLIKDEPLSWNDIM